MILQYEIYLQNSKLTGYEKKCEKMQKKIKENKSQNISK